MRRAVPILTLFAVAACATGGTPRETFSLRIAGRTELPVSHVVRVTYLPRSDAWSCTRYSWGAGRRVPKIRTRDYEVSREDSSWSAVLPILSWGTGDYCEWEADFVTVLAGSWNVGVAAIDPVGRGAYPPATTLECSVGEFSQKWICVDLNPSPRDVREADSQLRVDLVRR
jgi:hypothetical protein